MSKPLGLRFSLSDPDVTVTWQTGLGGERAVDAIETPWIKADVVYNQVDQVGYDIEFFARDDNGAWEASPYVTWTIDEVVTPFPGISVIQKESGVTKVAEYVYAYDVGNSLWKLESIDWTSGQAVTMRTETEQWVGSDPIVRLYTVINDQDGLNPGIWYQASDYWTDFSTPWGGWAWARTKSVVDPGGDALTTEWNYNQTPNIDPNATGRDYLTSIERADGSWVWYLYDTQGRNTAQVHAWGSAGLPASAPTVSQYHSFQFNYGVAGGAHPDDDGTTFPLRPRGITEQIEGTIVSKTYHSWFIDPTPSTDLYYVQERTIDPTAGFGDADNLTTTMIYWDGDELKPKSIASPDGRLDTYADPVYGRYSFDPQDPGSSGLSGGGADRKDIITHGTLSSPNGVAYKTTQETVITRGGVPMMEETAAYDGTSHTRVGWTARKVDGRFRAEEIHGSNGAVVEREFEDCCNPGWTKDESGIETESNTDLLGRQTDATKIASTNILTEITYESPTGTRRVITDIGNISGSPIVSTTREYDLAGRLTKSIDDAGLETIYSYSSGAGGGMATIVNYPDGTNKVTSRYRDGRVLQITGGAAVEQYYVYGTPSGNQSVKVEFGSSGSTRFTETIYDPAGRVETEERSGWAEDPGLTSVFTYYEYRAGGDGRLEVVKTAEAGQNPDENPLYGWTWYVYNDDIDVDGLPVLQQTVVDINGNKTIDDTSDRISETITEYKLIASDWWLETESTIFTTDTVPDPPVNVPHTTWQRQRLTGFTGDQTAQSESEDIFNNVISTTTEINRSTKTITVTTDYPNSTGSAVSTTVNGFLTSNTARTGETTTFDYDSIGRRNKTTDPRLNDTTIQYEVGTGRIASVTRIGTPGNYVTSYGYYGDSETPALRNGKLNWVENPGLNRTFYDYDPALGGALGGVTHVWGAAAQPIQVEYDSVYGQVSKLHTFQAGAGWEQPDWPTVPGPADITEWQYDADTGLVNKKIYADLSEVSLSYLADGRIDVRTWARQINSLPVTTDYDYDPNTAELTGITYSANAATPPVSFTYDRLGRIDTVTDAVGTRTFSFDDDLNPDKEIINSSGDPQLYYREITREYEPEPGVFVPSGFVVGRPKKVQVGVAGDAARDYETEYFYDSGNARFNRVSGPGLPNYGAVYNFDVTSGLLDRIDYKSNASTTVADTTYTYEADRNLIASVENKWGATSISKYAYRHDALGRRDSIIRDGTAHEIFPNVKHHDAYGYNPRNALLDATRYNNTVHGDTSNPVPTKNFDYTYDNAGNRATYMVAEQTAQTENYCANNLNQYDTIDTEVVCPPTIPADESFGYDPDGNMETDGTFSYKWDGENRLIDVTPTIAQTGDKKLAFTYDYRGRRVQKRVWQLVVSEWVEIERRKFVYNGWNVLLELEPDDLLNPTDDVVLRKYTWGLDLSGSFQGAGGIGGLLAMHEPDATTPKNYLYFYDANGNVGQLVDIDNSGAIVAHYEYDPYGGVTVSTGTYAGENPFRFSTKYWDDESGLGYWGFRYYSSRLGRWLRRDRSANTEASTYITMYTTMHSTA